MSSPASHSRIGRIRNWRGTVRGSSNPFKTQQCCQNPVIAIPDEHDHVRQCAETVCTRGRRQPPSRKSQSLLEGMTMQAAIVRFCLATFMLVPLMDLDSAIAEPQGMTSEQAPRGDTMTARAVSTERADACDSATGKAWNLCMIRGLYNITGVNCDCARADTPASRWECVATAVCQK
jgi:hypothetical protein